LVPGLLAAPPTGAQSSCRRSRKALTPCRAGVARGHQLVPSGVLSCLLPLLLALLLNLLALLLTLLAVVV
jgi:hypothetical protein